MQFAFFLTIVVIGYQAHPLFSSSDEKLEVHVLVAKLYNYCVIKGSRAISDKASSLDH